MAGKRVVLGHLRAVFAQTWICFSSRRVLALQGVKWSKLKNRPSQNVRYFLPYGRFWSFLVIFAHFCSKTRFLRNLASLRDFGQRDRFLRVDAVKKFAVGVSSKSIFF